MSDPIGQQKLTAANTVFNVRYHETADKAVSEYPKVADRYDIKGAIGSYPFLGQMAPMERLDKSRRHISARVKAYTIQNEVWMSPALDIPRTAIESDTTGVYETRFRLMGNLGPQHLDTEVGKLFPAGFTEKCYDGDFFFGIAHKDDPAQAVQSNKTDAVFSADAVQDAMAAMRGFKGVEGQSLQVRATTLVVGPDLEFAARAMVAPLGQAEAPRPLAGLLEVIVIDQIPAGQWYILDTRNDKPFIVQIGEEAELQMQDTAASDSVFNRDAYSYGVRSYDGFGFGPWFLAYGSTGDAQ